MKYFQNWIQLLSQTGNSQYLFHPSNVLGRYNNVQKRHPHQISLHPLLTCYIIITIYTIHIYILKMHPDQSWRNSKKRRVHKKRTKDTQGSPNITDEAVLFTTALSAALMVTWCWLPGPWLQILIRWGINSPGSAHCSPAGDWGGLWLVPWPEYWLLIGWCPSCPGDQTLSTLLHSGSGHFPVPWATLGKHPQYSKYMRLCLIQRL